jgi:hypothetical protein
LWTFGWWSGIKTQMGTNLLNLSPSFLVKRAWLGARLRLLWLAILHSRCLRFVFAFDPYLPLQPFTTVASGSPFEILADFFREWVAIRPSALSPCGVPAFRVLPFSCDRGFHRKLPVTFAAFGFTLVASTTLRTLSPFFPVGRSIHVPSFRPDRASPASLLIQKLLTTPDPGFLPFCLAASDPNFSSFPLRFQKRKDALSRAVNQSLNQNIPGVLYCSCEHSLSSSLLRGPNYLENFPGLANLPIFDLLLQHWKEHSASFGGPDNIGLLLAILNSDPSVARILRPVRFGFQLN